MELRAGASLSALFGLRMLGLFFILPVFAVHAPQYAGGDNLLLVGVALGAYGVTQAILQIPFGMASDPKPVLIGAAALLLAVMTGLALADPGIFAMAGLLFAFFVAFNVLEAILPSLVSRIVPARARGTAIGVYNTAQTLGLFFGGLSGGWIAGRYGAGAVFGACAGLTGLWLAAAAGMRAVNPKSG